ncbi:MULTISPECIES: hydantoinase/oxoprolinase family protein [Cytobacillus]|uniref:N-methylhydantoinase A n=2 Tax=Cytobacillus TaxID=2675230 RepID=A0A800MUN2_CYTFI|nr:MULTISPECIES: hydantoinase/oxoprolinase family protein [Cytobacillus]AND40560.1 5-oxoprolinase [Cytobacillus oceanisediminis 2691]KAF0822701.1 N-methylhydantoinase A [Cytobacillus firmus]MCM3243083.1 hydantoinase/oxoprolinase family protein [Cytobacillus oceanisediminis]MCM3401032.1 hydantoinase/oxoprolinase family protein [Cytobacillus oceanisediminis]MDK7665325.1 hydantoinase/oxoprolinase family protein [Cytobacillus oceanisediminis]
MRISVDVGGTFTDVVTLDPDSGNLRLEKVETVPKNPAGGVLEGFRKAEVSFSNIDYFVHGTTLGLNALLTRTGADVAIITTKGFRDVYELGRTDRDEMYNFKYRKPELLVPRRHRYEVSERLDYQGSVITPFDREEAVNLAQKLREEGTPSVVVCFLHSYINPSHELEMEEVLKQEYPEVSVTLSHRLTREYREYERTSTAVIDAYIKPIMRTYLDRLGNDLLQEGYGGQFLLTRSGGGAMTAKAAKEEPVHSVMSGPAGGAIGAAYLADLTGNPNLITLDMGGTSLDTTMVVDGQISVENEATVESLPISTPMIDIRTIGSGGGSIAWIDDGGALQVGPKSAGADPGPACYGKGGKNATFTDAALTLGYLDAENFLGGAMTIDPNLSRNSINELAEELELTVEQTAAGIVRISEAKITGAIREISVERGFHPKDFALLGFGGGGGLVSCNVAREIGIPTVVIPPGAGNFSAWGMMMVDVVYDFAQTFVKGLENVDVAEINQLYGNLEADGLESLGQDGFSSKDCHFIRWAEMRYEGQEHTVKIEIPGKALKPSDIPEIAEKFGNAHEQQYGHQTKDPVEIVTLRVRAVGILSKPRIAKLEAGKGDASAAYKDSRPVFIASLNRTVKYAVYDRSALLAGDEIAGPAIIEEPSHTTIMHAGDILTVGEYGELSIAIYNDGGGKS